MHAVEIGPGVTLPNHPCHKFSTLSGITEYFSIEKCGITDVR